MPQTEEERKQKKKQRGKEYYEKNKEKLSKQHKEYWVKNKEKLKERNNEYMKAYSQTPQGKKVYRIVNWKRSGLLESKEKIEELYEIYTTIKLCEACDIELTRTGKYSSTDICLDHCHTTGRFRLMLCRKCNSMDNWKQYFC